jgi:hypothetical protein
MKSILAIILALIVANFAAAHGSHGAPGGDGSGLSVGAGFGLHIHQHDDETEVIPNAMFSLSYSESFFDDKLDFDFGLNYIPSFKKGYFEIEEHDHGHSHDHDGHDHDHDHDIFATRDFFQQVLCLEAGLTYNLSLAYFTTLSFSLENETDFYISPKLKGENSTVGVLTPGIKLNQGFSFGDSYVQYGLPLQYVSYFKEEEFSVGSDVTIGWQSKFGLRIEFIGHFLISPEAGFDGVDAIISYVLPIKNFSFYVNCEFEGIGMEESIGIVPGIGFTYSF